MKLFGKYKSTTPYKIWYDELSLGDVSEIPKPNDIIECIGRKWLVLNSPREWRLDPTSLFDGPYDKNRHVTIELQKIEEDEDTE